MDCSRVGRSLKASPMKKRRLVYFECQVALPRSDPKDKLRAYQYLMAKYSAQCVARYLEFAEKRRLR